MKKDYELIEQSSEDGLQYFNMHHILKSIITYKNLLNNIKTIKHLINNYGFFNLFKKGFIFYKRKYIRSP